ncbi:MAG: lipid-A-disaccharide synthase [Rhodospirillaceae bacterium]|jgi:lipid-A-disaccharide synthase|nr:lipid-A-disaccharide synthase [Rhodospirillaceae bacterium]
MTDVPRPMIYLIAGEESGDRLGGPLMRALCDDLDGEVLFAGIGGPMMTEAGLNSLFPMQELSVMGVTEVLPRLPRLIRRINQTVTDVRTRKPDVLITIDAPDFCFRVAKKLKGQGIPLVHYVAPTVWAWRPGRAEKVSRFLDHLLALLPFEPPFFEKHGLACTYVGHPVLQSGADKGDGSAFRNQHHIPSDTPLLVLLLGSRAGEVGRLLPIFTEAVEQLHRAIPNLEVLIPTVPATHDQVLTGTSSLTTPVHVLKTDQEKYDAFAAADVALAASGTVALELAMAGTPSVIGYKLATLTTLLARKVVQTPYVNLINIILKREAIPELILENCVADKLAGALETLFSTPDARAAQKHDYKAALAILGHGTISPNKRAAETIRHILQTKTNGAA